MEMHPIILEIYAKERQKLLLEQAKMYHLRKIARKSHPILREALFIRIGDLLISMGHRLINKYEPESACNGQSPDRYGCCPKK